ncbi:hypothetical protein O3597_26025 [Verrucosispora sp. WMMA2044]|uniref:8-oxoguanine DNA glycosylase OGG fold protein n=1 Tax=Verrucosispora sp. WMMA2044 TaxID=3016419 RepID=UPI00248B5F60|nr:hypothetical protein [Verrucosispora sp. WMMA2044]WBB48500.1 hypothetical protein O3597_26025 [Verrucosispora sp. WMMA2044]
MTEVEWTAALAEFVRSRAAGEAPDEITALAITERIIESFPEPTPAHAVRWKLAAWRRQPVDPAVADAVERVAHVLIHTDISATISRQQVGSHAGRPLDLFVATMAWGFGEQAYGWHRTRRILDRDGQQRLPALVDALRGNANRPAQTWHILMGPQGLRGLGPAFGTKLAYFASYSNERGDGPLIADRWTAWAFWAFAGTWDIRSSPHTYAEYVHHCHAWATRLHRRPDDVERAFFLAGPYIRQVWHQAMQ